MELHTRDGLDLLSWHWSRQWLEHELRAQGLDECLITIFGRLFPRYSHKASRLYHCWAESNHFGNDGILWDQAFPLGFEYAALFSSRTILPRTRPHGLKDNTRTIGNRTQSYPDNREHCVAIHHFKGYGRTAGD